MKKILIIDDSKEIHQIVTTVLGKAYNVMSILDVREDIFDIIEDFAPDLILLDVMMPNISGIQLCEEIKSTHLSDIPVVMMTALSDKDSIQNAFEAKANDYLIKPNDFNLLPHRVNFNIQQRVNLSEVSVRKKTLSRINDAAKIKYWLKDIKLLEESELLAVETLKSFYYGIKMEEVSEKMRADLIRDKIEAFKNLSSSGNQYLKYDLVIKEKSFTFIETISIVEGQVLGIIQNITNLSKDQKDLHELAYFDEKTGFANDNSLRKDCRIALAKAKLQKHTLAMVTLRLINLREIAESVGPGFYFKVIHYFRGTLPGIAQISENDIYLTAEDEIQFMLYNRDETQIRQTMTDILESVERKFSFKNKLYAVELSLGISQYPKDGEEMNRLIADSQFASHNMQGAMFYLDSYRKAKSKKIMLKMEMAEALEDNQFECYFQPQIDLKTYHITGAELLIRWHHPQHGFTFPSYFIEEAEANGQIVDIGYYTLRKAFEYCKRWSQEGLKIKISVNLSAKQISNDMLFIKTLEKHLKEFDIPSSLIGIEITEGSLLEDFELTKSFLLKLKGLGIKISLDDFGTGFSSLKYLKDLPIDCIKIDRHFVTNLESDKFSRAFVSCISTLANNLSMEVIAEGVETKECAEILRSLGCSSIQGYSMPMDEKSFLELVRS